MRMVYGMMAAAMEAMKFGTAMRSFSAADAQPMLVTPWEFTRTIGFQRNPSRITTGKAYPFSSDRQNARYARQIAAGQIRNAKAEA